MPALPRTRAIVLALAVLASAAPAADLQGPVLTGLKPVAHPAPAGSGEPALSVSPGGEVWMTWFEPRGAEHHALVASRLGGDRWSKPAVVAESLDFFVNWADVPRVLAGDQGALVVHYPVRSGEEPYAYDVWVRRSGDGGATWSAPARPHTDGTATEHGFVSLLAEGAGTRIVWLDGRNFAGAESHGEGAMADMMVRTAVWGADGAFRDEAVLDPRACDCCPTAAVATSAGVLVAYRDRSAEEVRDIALVRLERGRWSEPQPLHRDGWTTPACPVNGPALDARGERVVAAWFTMAGGMPQVKVAFSRDGGRRFATPIRADWGDPLGRVDVVLLDDGDALLAWMEQRDKAAELLVRRVRRDGAIGLPLTVARTTASRASGIPQLVVAGDRAVLAWTESDRTRQVRTAVATVPR